MRKILSFILGFAVCLFSGAPAFAKTSSKTGAAGLSATGSHEENPALAHAPACGCPACRQA